MKSYDFTKSKPLQKEVADIVLDFNSKSFTLINNGVNASAAVSYLKNDEITRLYLNTLGKLGKDFAKDDIIPNVDAITAFIARERGADALSGRVWQVGDQLRGEMEIFLGTGIMNGDSSKVISRRIRKYLNNPQAYIRRIRDKNGNLVPSAKTLLTDHPGTGVYRSAYKNAMRLIRTETNQAYLLADHYRWLNTPYITAFKISLSGSHPHYPFIEICEELQGIYPKWFIWVGWHPQCLCHATPVMTSKDDFKAYLRGEKPVGGQNLDNLPPEFQAWLQRNQEKILNSKNPPYFILDNYVNGDPTKGLLKTMNISKIPQPKKIITPIIPAVPIDPAEQAIKAVQGAKTIDEINALLPQVFGNPVKIEYKLTNVQVYKDVITRIYELKKEYNADFHLFGNDKRKNVYASAGTGSFNAKGKYFNSPNMFVSSLKNDVQAKFHPKGCDTIKSLIDHEFTHMMMLPDVKWVYDADGHIINYIRVKQNPEFASALLEIHAQHKLKLTTIKNVMKETIREVAPIIDAGYQDSVGKKWSEILLSRADTLIDRGVGDFINYLDYASVPEVQKVKLTNLTNLFKDNIISRYSLKNIDEFAAEGFTSALNNPGGNEWATQIKELFDKYYKK